MRETVREDQREQGGTSEVEGHREAARRRQGLDPLRNFRGWEHILDALSEAVEFHERRSEAGPWRVTRLEEEFGKLRIEATGGDPHTRALEQFVRVMSGHSCRSCGLPGSERQIGIVQTTLCNACYEAERTEAQERLLAMSQGERVTENKLVIMQTLLKGGADPNYQDEIGQGAVHMAAKSMTRPEAIRILVRGGGDPNLRENNGWMPLHGAAAIGETPEVIAALAEVGADVNGTGNIEGTPLVLAVTSNPNMPITRALIDAGANPDTADSEGRAALHWAAPMNAASAIFTALVEAGADPDQPDNRGRTPVHWAARWHEDRTVVTILIEAGEDPERKHDQGCTALDYMS